MAGRGRAHGRFRQSVVLNVFRTCGPVPGVLVFVLDAAKGALPVLAVCLLPPVIESSPDPVFVIWLALVTGMAAALGHIFSPFLSFKGERCGNVSGRVSCHFSRRCNSCDCGGGAHHPSHANILSGESLWCRDPALCILSIYGEAVGSGECSHSDHYRPCGPPCRYSTQGQHQAVAKRDGAQGTRCMSISRN